MWTRAFASRNLRGRPSKSAPPHVATVTLAFALSLGAGSCAGAKKRPASLEPVPVKLTTATLVGPLCEAEVCQCIDGGANPGLPDQDGVKRYQFKLGPTDNELWVTVDDMVMYKTNERATECFIVDLRADEKHEVSLRAKSANGFGARLTINEIGAEGPYSTFMFQCGSPGPCTLDQLASFKASLARYKRQLHDPCGSTKVRAPHWLTGEAPDRVHPDELQLDFILHVYKFPLRYPSGHPECRDRY